MKREGTPAIQQQVADLIREGERLVEMGQSSQARGRFARVLALQHDHVRALLWLATLDDDPRQSMRYFGRVLRISPGHPGAQAGMHWAQQRLVARNQPTKNHSHLSWLDTFLLSSLALVAVMACLILGWMAWQAPSAVRAAYLPTPTMAPPLTPLPTSTPTLLPTYTPRPTATATPSPTPTMTPLPTPTATLVVPGELPRYTALGEKWIEIVLSTQTLTAYEGEMPMLTALVSTGIARFPTPPGEYAIWSKVRSQVMSGPGYSLPNVEFVSYFYKAYALHGTYWHNNFGHPMSHGCINLTNADAQWIFEWAPIGTRVLVRD